MYNVPSFLRDLQRLDRPASREESARGLRAEVLLDSFLKNTPFLNGAVFLRDSDETYRLAASIGVSAPEELRCTLAAHVRHAEDLDSEISDFITPRIAAVVPLRDSRDQFGFVALGGGDNQKLSSDEVDLLGAASMFAGAMFEKHRMASEVREGEFQLKYRLWELESLYDIGLSIASTLDLDQLADAILMRTVSLLNARRAALYLKDGERFALRRAFGDVRSQFFDVDIDPSLTRKLLEEGEAIHFENGADSLFPGCRSFVALPVKNGQEVIGVLAAADREQRDGSVGPFSESEVRLLGLFANQAAIALENANLHRQALEKQAMEREIDLAATIQLNILPRSTPKLHGFEIDGFSRPAKQLGGDYHFFSAEDDALTFCVADVAGKSVPAAILVSALHAALQLLLDEGRDLGEIATELNRHIHRWSAENKFITLLLATVDRKEGVLRYVNAGHNPGYVIVGGLVEALPSHGLPIGILSGSKYNTQTRSFPTGSIVLAYSDGITEAENASEEEFDYERLTSILDRSAAEPLAVIRRRIVAAVDEFTAGLPQRDDQTIVLVRTSQESAR